MKKDEILKLLSQQVQQWERLANRLSDELGTTHVDVIYCESKVTELTDEINRLKF